MTRTPHDSFAKDFFEELLSPLGKVEINRQITDEPRYIDILFSPYSPSVVPLDSIGLLSRLAVQTAIIEVFRNQPSDVEVLMSVGKLCSYIAELNREAEREKASLKDKDLGRLWIITTTASQRLLDDYGAKLDSDINCQGVYSFDKGWRGSIIAVNQLPITDETLWLRVLGKGRVQRQAVDELLALPDTNAYKQNTVRMLANLRIVTIRQINLSEDDQETAMNLSTAYVEWEQKTLQQGEQKVIIRQLNRQVGEIQPQLIEQIRQLPVEELELLSEALLDFSTVADLQQWLQSRPKAVEQD